MRKITTLLLIALFVNLANAQVQKADVWKPAADNPTLAIEAFNGSNEARQKLERMLSFSGWFKVVPQDQARNAVFKVQAAGNDTQFALNLQGNGKSISSQKQASNIDEAARLVVDDVLKQLFNIQGLCNCKIAFVVPDAQNRREICTIYPDGTNFEILTKNNAISTEPSWGHANAMVYTLAKNNALHIVLMDLSKRVQRIISSARGLNSSAALSSNGQFVSLALSLGDQVDLYSHDLATNQTKRITNDRYVESSPTWSPDGKQICYVSDLPGKPSLFIVSAAGGAPKRLQLGGGECVSPDWSHVSNKICFSQKGTNGHYVINVLDMAKSGNIPETVTLAAGDWEAPSWAPDGRHLVCTRATGGQREIVIVDTWLRTFRPLSAKGKYSLPAWQPAR